MAHFIELYQPLRPQIQTIRSGLALPDGTESTMDYDKRSVQRAYEYRKKMLDQYLDAVEGVHCLSLEKSIGKETAAPITAAVAGAMLGAMGAKAEAEAFMEQVGGYVCVVENWLDSTGRLITPAVLVMACLQLLDTNKFIPKPAEFMEAFREAANQRHTAMHRFSDLEYWIRKCDAVLLLCATEKWTEPYYLGDYEDILKAMLAAHEANMHMNEKLNDGTFARLIACAKTMFLQDTGLLEPPKV